MLSFAGATARGSIEQLIRSEKAPLRAPFFASYRVVVERALQAPKKLRPAFGGRLAAREPVWDGEGWGCDRVAGS